MTRSGTPQAPPHTSTDSPISKLRHKIGQATKQRTKEPVGRRYECYDYLHPDFGYLTIVLDHQEKRIAAVSFTPTRNVIYKLVPSIDWYFKNGKCLETGIGQKEWEGWCKD